VLRFLINNTFLMELETLRFIEGWIILGIERYHHLGYEDISVILKMEPR